MFYSHRRGEKMLIILPMAHIFTLVGCIFAPLLHHMTSVIPIPCIHASSFSIFAISAWST